MKNGDFVHGISMISRMDHDDRLDIWLPENMEYSPIQWQLNGKMVGKSDGIHPSFQSR